MHLLNNINFWNECSTRLPNFFFILCKNVNPLHFHVNFFAIIFPGLSELFEKFWIVYAHFKNLTEKFLVNEKKIIFIFIRWKIKKNKWKFSALKQDISIICIPFDCFSCKFIGHKVENQQRNNFFYCVATTNATKISNKIPGKKKKKNNFTQQNKRRFT